MVNNFIAFIIFLYSTCLYAVADGIYYQVDRSQGDAKVRLPFELDWENVKHSQFLPLNTLLKVELNSRITLKKATITQKKIDYSDIIEINSPTIIRLNANLEKKVDKNYVIIDRFPDKVSDTPGIFTKESIKDSFNRLITLVKAPPENSKLNANISPSNSFSQSKKQIEIFFPIDGTFKKSEEFPVDLEISWAENKNIEQYKIFIWEKENQRPESDFITPESSKRVKILKPGSYYVQIMSGDEKWESKVHLFHIYPFERLKSSIPEEDLTHTDLKKPTIQLLTPKDNFVYYTKQINSQNFKWKPITTPGFETKYFIIIKNTKTNIENQYATKNPEISLNLKEGDYQWYILGKLTNLNKMNTYFSEKQSISIAKQEKDSINQIFQSFSEENHNSTIYLDIE